MNYTVIATATKSFSLNVNPTVALLLLIVTLAAGLAFIIAYTRKSIAKNTIDVQSEQIDALESRRRSLQEEVDELKMLRLAIESAHNKKLSIMTANLKDLEVKIATLENMKSGTDAVKALEKTLRSDISETHKLLEDLICKLN